VQQLVRLDASVLPGGAAVRLVAARPPLALLSSLYGARAQVALRALAATDPALRRTLGGVHLVQPSDWPTGPGAGFIVAPFVRAPHPGLATRFSDGSYGLWYGAEHVATAQAEVGHHLEGFLRRTRATADRLPRTILHATPDVTLPVVDLRPPAPVPPGVLDPTDYAASRAFGAACRRAQQWGIVWPSVRRAGGTCVGVLRPPLLAACREVGGCVAEWDGARLVGWR
jgi:hypothetical protein